MHTFVVNQERHERPCEVRRRPTVGEEGYDQCAREAQSERRKEKTLMHYAGKTRHAPQRDVI